MSNINTQSMLRVGTLIHGGVYRIESYLASGGFGNTYVVRNVEFDEVYALKEFFIKGVCQRDGDNTSISVSNTENTQCFAQQREKFKKEARRIRSLKNEHIVRVHDLFEENGTAYYVMDLVDGESLSSRLNHTNQPLTEAEVVRLLPQIVDGLQAIHHTGIWHLDIKPANIMVDKKGVVKLIDFGASKQQSNSGGATMSTGISYTNGYAPGEQMAQEYDEFGPWTDFYALGATIYKLLTLQNPPSVTKVAEDETADKHVALPMPGVSDKMRKLVVWMMQDKRKRRPQCADEILARLPEPVASQQDETTVMAEPLHNAEVTVVSQTEIEEKKEEMDQSISPTKIIDSIVFWIILALLIGSTSAGLIWGIPKIELYKNLPEASFENGTLRIGEVCYNMVRVEAGTFTMGATSEMEDPWDKEKPAHQVTLTKDYYIGRTEVTQALWKAVMGSNPSFFKGDNKPVECVSWEDCQEFISRLNKATGKKFRMPTEAEWEFAARGGNKSQHYQYSGSNTLSEVAWYDDNSGSTTHDVGTKKPNELGIYDMSGNVWEWCSDWYGDYSRSDQTNPKGPSSGSDRVSRGGGWYYYAGYCRSSNRYGSYPDYRINRLGLRLALSE